MRELYGLRKMYVEVKIRDGSELVLKIDCGLWFLNEFGVSCLFLALGLIELIGRRAPVDFSKLKLSELA